MIGLKCLTKVSLPGYNNLGFFLSQLQYSEVVDKVIQLPPKNLFLIAAEVLSIIIKITPEIVGIKIGKTEFKTVQYVDDTTIILDGSRDSLQATLNMLEIYDSLSGLKMNMEKTKIIWIDKKKHSKDKLLISAKLDWGSSELNLFGIDFLVDLKELEFIR